jgi:hypothetical protein
LDNNCNVFSSTRYISLFCLIFLTSLLTACSPSKEELINQVKSATKLIELIDFFENPLVDNWAVTYKMAAIISTGKYDINNIDKKKLGFMARKLEERRKNFDLYNEIYEGEEFTLKKQLRSDNVAYFIVLHISRDHAQEYYSKQIKDNNLLKKIVENINIKRIIRNKILSNLIDDQEYVLSYINMSDDIEFLKTASKLIRNEQDLLTFIGKQINKDVMHNAITTLGDRTCNLDESLSKTSVSGLGDLFHALNALSSGLSKDKNSHVKSFTRNQVGELKFILEKVNQQRPESESKVSMSCVTGLEEKSYSGGYLLITETLTLTVKNEKNNKLIFKKSWAGNTPFKRAFIDGNKRAYSYAESDFNLATICFKIDKDSRTSNCIKNMRTWWEKKRLSRK